MVALKVIPHLGSVCVINKPFYDYCENEDFLIKKASTERY